MECLQLPQKRGVGVESLICTAVSADCERCLPVTKADRQSVDTVFLSPDVSRKRMAKAFGKYAEAHWVAKALESTLKRTGLAKAFGKYAKAHCRFGVPPYQRGLGGCFLTSCAIEKASRFC